jgi:tRNA G18 (ribose-2'-O)-methylase SpoU
VKKRKIETLVVLDNIRSTFNVGSIFRTSDALDISKLILCGTTPAPKDRFGRDRADIAKVSLGAEKTVDWEYFDSTLKVVKSLKREGYKIIMIEQSPKSVDYKKIKIPKNSKVAFVLGTEVEGISKNILKLADVVAEIPMLGSKESLNVSVAFGVAVFRILEV